MATSVVVSQIAFSDDGQTLHVKGTCGGNNYQTNLSEEQDSLVSQVQSGTANAVATAFLARYTNYAAAVASIASQTITHQTPTGQNVSIVFGSTPVALVGYEYLEITATVGGNSTILHLKQDEFLEWYGAGVLNQHLGRRLVAQNSMNGQIASGIAAFSI